MDFLGIERRQALCLVLPPHVWMGVPRSGEDFRGKPRRYVIESCHGIVTNPGVAS